MTSAVSIRKVIKTFGQTKALCGVDLEIAQGEIFGLLGPNGAGKTTLISAMAGLNRPDSGDIVVMGHNVRSDYQQARQSLGVVPQELVFDPFFSVRETLQLQSGYFGIKNNDAWIDELLANLDLTAKADANMRMLSGGMKRRVLVAQALVHRPPVIVLDEPTAGVDVELRQTLWKFVRRLNNEGHTIVLTTHYLDEAEMLCGRIGMLKAGQLVALDSTANLLSQATSQLLRVRSDGLLPEGYQHLSVDGAGWVELPFQRYEEIERFLGQCRQQGMGIHEIAIAQPALEDVFVRIMQGQGAAS